MQSAEAATPAPTYGTSASSSRPWTVPSSPNGPCSTGKTTSTPPSARGHRAVGQPARASSPRAGLELGCVAPRAERPAPVAVDLDRRRRRSRAGSSAGDAARPTRRETSCSLERPPESTATRRLTAARGGGVGDVGRRRRGRSSWRSVRGRVSAAAHELADGERHRRPLLDRPAGRVLREHEAVLARVGDVRVTTVDLKPASSQRRSRVGERHARDVGTRRRRALRDASPSTFERCTLRPAGGSCATRCPFASFESASTRATVKPAPWSALAALRRTAGRRRSAPPPASAPFETLMRTACPGRPSARRTAPAPSPSLGLVAE